MFQTPRFLGPLTVRSSCDGGSNVVSAWWSESSARSDNSVRRASFYDPSVTDCFNLYLIHATDSWNTLGITAGTIIPPTTPLTPVSSQSHLFPNPPPWEKRARNQPLSSISPPRKGRELLGESNLDGFHSLIHRAERESELRQVRTRVW